jgi:GNAT superfamily N-acetyltransferase
MTQEQDNIIRLTGRDAKAAAGTVARAFLNYPVSVFFMPDEAKRRKKQPAIFARLIRAAAVNGEVYATSRKMEGVAVWFTPDSKQSSWWQRLCNGLLISSFFMNKKQKASQRAFEQYSNSVRKRVLPARYWYLQILGVAPEQQGKGFSGRLLRPMLARAEREGLLVFLETQLPKNVELYKHFGFRVVEEGTIPGSNVHSWAMVKDAGK